MNGGSRFSFRVDLPSLDNPLKGEGEKIQPSHG